MRLQLMTLDCRNPLGFANCRLLVECILWCGCLYCHVTFNIPSCRGHLSLHNPLAFTETMFTQFSLACSLKCCPSLTQCPLSHVVYSVHTLTSLSTTPWLFLWAPHVCMPTHTLFYQCLSCFLAKKTNARGLMWAKVEKPWLSPIV